MLMFQTMSSRAEDMKFHGAPTAWQSLLAVAALTAMLLGAPSAGAQEAPGTPIVERSGADTGVDAGAVRSAPGTTGAAATTSTAQPRTTASDIDLSEAPLVAGMLEDEALHRDRIGRIRRLRQLAVEGNQRERLGQLDDLELQEVRRHEARAVRDRSLLSERSALAVDDFVKRGGLYRARGKDIAIARQRKFGSSGDDISRRRANADGSPERSATRATRAGTSGRSSGSASRGGSSRGGSSSGGTRSGGPR